MKRCIRCGETRSVACFSSDSTRKDRLHPYCKPCNKIRRHTYFIGNKDLMKDYVWKRRLGKEFGITPLDYDRMYQQQSGKCLGCERHQTEIKGRLCVDHDHKTGHIRGLLCRPCNLVIGNARDSVENLQRLISYLRRSEDHSHRTVNYI